MEKSIAICVTFLEWIVVRHIKIWQKNQSRNLYVTNTHVDSQIYFTNVKVPKFIRDEDISNNIISFSRHCIQGQVLESDFPPRMNNKNHLECHTCKSNTFDCAYEMFRNNSSSVVKLYSIISNVCSLVLFLYRSMIGLASII